MRGRGLNRPPPADAEYVVGEMYEFKPEDDKVIHVPAPFVELALREELVDLDKPTGDEKP